MVDYDGRWIRWNCNALNKDWLDQLGYPFNLIWNPVVAYIKQHGNNRGVCAAISARVFARIHGMPESDVQRLLEAAIEADQLIVTDEVWIITDLQPIQSPDAERKRQERGGGNVQDNQVGGQRS